MKIRVRNPSFLLAVAAGASATLVACSSLEGRRESFDIDGEDSGNAPEAALPDASSSVDGSARDGGSTKAPFDPADEPIACASAAASCAVQIVAGENHFCARMSNGSVRCWGDNAKGALGASGSPGDAGAGDGGAGDIVGAVTGLQGVSQLSAGGTTTCAVISGGDVRCWGGNDRGQLGLRVSPPTPDSGSHAEPSAVALPSAAARVDVGTTSACAVLASGTVWCWGDNSRRQLARSTAEPVGGPAQAMLGTNQTARTAASNFSAFAISRAGDVRSWGAVAGSESSVSAREASIPQDPNPLSIGLGPATSFSVSSAVGSDAHACAVVSGDLYCWGRSASGALGTGIPEPALYPTAVHVSSTKAWPQQVAAGRKVSCVRLTDGTVECAGTNERGALGIDTKDTYSMFFKPADAFKGHAVAVAVTASAVCALVQDGSVLCWGSNEKGELGQGTTDTKANHIPVSVGF